MDEHYLNVLIINQSLFLDWMDLMVTMLSTIMWRQPATVSVVLPMMLRRR